MTVTTTYGLQTLEPEFGANSFTPGTQSFPNAIGLNNGGWATAYNTNNGNFILLNFYDANNDPVGGFRIPYDDPNTEPIGQPTLTELANGNILVTWDDNNPAELGLRGRIFTQDGIAVGGELSLSGSSISFEDPDSAALPDGGFLVSFTFGGNVFFGRYNAAGGQVGGFTQVNTAATTGTQNQSSVTVLSDGGWVVSFTDTNVADQPVRATIFNSNGTVRTPDFVIDGFGDNTQSSVQALDGGRWAVVYTDSGWVEGGTLGNGITMVIYNSVGTSQTGFIHVNTPSTVDERSPSISLLDNGFILVTWTRPIGAGDDDIYARVYDQNGNPVLGQFAIDADIGLEDNSAIAGLLNGEFVTAWQDNQTDGDGGRVSAQVNALTRTSVGDAASDTINVDSLRDFVSAGDGNDTIAGGGLLAFENDVINGQGGSDRILARADISLLNTTVASIEEIEFDASNVDDKAVTIRANQIGVGLAANLVVDFAAVGSIDRFRVEMGSATSVDLSQFVIQDFDAGGTEFDRLIVLGDDDSESMRGTSVRDELYGLGGNDVLEGGPGGDYLSGGLGSDRATYANAAGSVTVNLSNAAQNAGEAAGDTYNSVENLTGSAFNDILTGTNGTNSILGGAGVDSLRGLAGSDNLFGNDGNDTLDGGLGSDYMSGGAGSDRATYINATTGVRASLIDPTTNTGEASGDTYNSVENLTGSNFNDTLIGNNGANRMSGADGNDSLLGYAGSDVIFGGDGNDRINGHLNADTLEGNDGNDTFIFNTALGGGNIDTITDFNFVQDSIELYKTVFGAIVGSGTLTAAQFVANVAGVATTAAHRIIYDTSDGRLIYDNNGNAAGGAVVFAQLDPGLGITNTDFIVI